jgi:hypothetical protein
MQRLKQPLFAASNSAFALRRKFQKGRIRLGSGWIFLRLLRPNERGSSETCGRQPVATRNAHNLISGFREEIAITNGALPRPDTFSWPDDLTDYQPPGWRRQSNVA